MDPHQLHNNLGIPGSSNHQLPAQNYFFPQQPQQYLPQNILPNQIFDASLFQQPNLLMNMQAATNPQAFYQQPVNFLQQQLLQQQQLSNPQMLQAVNLHQIQSLQQQNDVNDHIRQQKLIEQQKLLDQQKQEQHRLLQQQIEMARKQQEEEMARKKAEDAARREEARKALEQQRKEEEARRLMEAQLEKQRLEQEMMRREEEARIAELRRLQSEQEQQRRDVESKEAEMRAKTDSIARPLSVIGCAPLTRLVSLVPFPSENAAVSLSSAVSHETEVMMQPHEDTLEAIIEALHCTDVSSVGIRGEREGGGMELDEATLPPFILHILSKSPSALNAAAHREPEQVEEEEQQPSTSSSVSASASKPMPTVAVDPNALKRMISLGKQPKGQGGNSKRKKEEVENLYDSLTDYFDPTQGRRKRQKVKTYEEEQLESREIELVAESEAKLALREKEREAEHEGMLSDADEVEGTFYDRKKLKRKEKEVERPPTPTHVLRQREEEWRERERRRLEKRRTVMANEEWSSDVRSENDTFNKAITIIDNIVENIDVDHSSLISEDSEVPQEALIDRSTLDDLRDQMQKLKLYKKVHEIPTERLVRLLTILERNIRDAVAMEGCAPLVPMTDDDAGDEESEAFRELVDERLVRAADAACVALLTMTAHKVPKQVLLEDTMERAVQLCKQYLSCVIYPSSDSLYQGVGKPKKNVVVEDSRFKRRKRTGSSRTPVVQLLYTRMMELMGCFSELVRHHSLHDTLYHQLNTTALSCFFVNNVGELQIKAMSVLGNVFSRGDEHTRNSVLMDLLNSMHRMPAKSAANSYRISEDVSISNTTCLFMQLIQSSIKLPKKRKEREDEMEEEVGCDLSREDAVVRDSFTEAKQLSSKFLMALLNKCASKGEDDYRRILDLFLHDLLAALMSPAWPVTEMILNSLGCIISNLYKQKGVDMAVRQMALEYLGLICARLKKERKEGADESNVRLNMVVKTLLLCENEDNGKTMDDVDVSCMTSNELLKRAEQGLIDYLVVTHSGNELSIEYAVMFYVGEWYRMTMEDLNVMKERLEKAKKEAENEKERRKAERKLEKGIEKTNRQKHFLIHLADKRNIRKRTELLMRSNNTMLHSDALWLIKFLALQRDFCNSFDLFLKQILYGVTSEQSVLLRTKAMKSLTLIIEVDQNVLSHKEVRGAVHARMTDPNASVREATIDLLGKFILARPALIHDYYTLLLERIKDSGTAVRKRVIRIIREYVDKHSEHEKAPEMLSRVIRRVNDEDGVKKLVVETFTALWMHPVKYTQQVQMKVWCMTEMMRVMAREGGGQECVEGVLNALIKGENADRGMLLAAKQIVDCLMDTVIALEDDKGEDALCEGVNGEEMASLEKAKERQEKLLSSLSTLSAFSKVRPEMLVKHAGTLQPYLSMNAKNNTEQTVLNEVINMLERVFPLMDHPSPELIARIDQSLAKILVEQGLLIAQSAVSCAATLYKKSPRYRPAMSSNFIQLLKVLSALRKKFDIPNAFAQFVSSGKLTSILRGVFSIGVLARYFDWDTILDGDEEAAFTNTLTALTLEEGGEHVEGQEEEKRAIRDTVFTLLHYFACRPHDAIRHKALVGLGHICAEYPAYLQRKQVMDIYAYCIKSKDEHFLHLKIQVLKNLEMFLSNEEKKMIKSHQEWEKIKDEQELKEMDLGGSGLGSAVIQKYWHLVLESYFHRDADVRLAAMQVVWQTLYQGLVTPGNSLHVLIAMSTDPIVHVRNKTESLVKDIDSKYQGMVQSKAVQGMRAAFRLHSTITDRDVLLRGMRLVDQTATANCGGRKVAMQHGAARWTNDGQALLSALYQSLRGNRQQRRSVVGCMLRLFSEDCREKLSVQEWIFVADNIAMFPYQVLDEPMYVMHTIDSIVSLSGQSIINQFKANLLPSANPSSLGDEDIDFEPDALYRRLPADKKVLYDLLDNSQACFTLLYLKMFLMKLYAITEAKLLEYSPSEAAKVYEKSVSRKNVHMFLPMTAVTHIQKETAAEGSPQEDWHLVSHISQFRRMLLSLDRVEEEEEEKKGDEREEEEEGREAEKGEETTDDNEDTDD